MPIRFLCFIAWLSFLPLAFGAEQDALAIDANIEARHMPYGGIMDPILSLPDLTHVVDYTRCGDSAIWTGHYLAAEAFRYSVTGAADALSNINNAISTIDNLINVTGGNVLARCALPADSPYAASISSQESANGIHNGNSFGAPWIWVGNTSRDQYVGVFFGLLVTYDMVSDQTVRNWCSYLVTRLLQNLLDNLWNVVMPDGSISTTFLVRPDQQLALLLIGKHVNGGAFETTYSSESNAISPTVPVPIGVDCTDQTSSYFKFNLDYLTFYTLKRLGSGYSSFWYGLAYDELHATTASHQNAHFNMIDRAINGPNTNRDAQTRPFSMPGCCARGRMYIATSAGSFQPAARTKPASPFLSRTGSPPISFGSVTPSSFPAAAMATSRPQASITSCPIGWGATTAWSRNERQAQDRTVSRRPSHRAPFGADQPGAQRVDARDRLVCCLPRRFWSGRGRDKRLGQAA